MNFGLDLQRPPGRLAMPPSNERVTLAISATCMRSDHCSYWPQSCRIPADIINNHTLCARPLSVQDGLGGIVVGGKGAPPR